MSLWASCILYNLVVTSLSKLFTTTDHNSNNIINHKWSVVHVHVGPLSRGQFPKERLVSCDFVTEINNHNNVPDNYTNAKQGNSLY